MRVKKGIIDSLNFKDNHLEALFINRGNYTLNKVKGKGDIYKPKEWVEAFGKEMGKIKNGKLYFPFVEAIIISDKGSSIKFPLKKYTWSSKSQTVEFAGLHGYTDRSKGLKYILMELLGQMKHMALTRCDIAIDFYDEVIPKSIINNILKTGRKPKAVGTTIYYKSKSEKKSNPYFDIKIYNKTEEVHRMNGVKLNKQIWRLELSFKTGYMRGFKGEDIDSEELIQKMEKTIKKITGKSIKISPFK